MADKIHIEDDRPAPPPPGAFPEFPAPLVPFNGEKPPAPPWFEAAIAQEPERLAVPSNGTNIELLVWGEKGKPGLLLVHGNSAHADWWSFIAPLLAQGYRVGAMSLAGMGGSDWREAYAFEDFAADARACAEAGGLNLAGKPIYIGHSFGGAQVFFTAAFYPQDMRAAILVDTGFGGPPPDSEEFKKMQAHRERQIRNIPTLDKPAKVYGDLPSALARFRFMPPQPVHNLYIADFIARRSLKTVKQADGSDGYIWRFDPAMWAKLDRRVMQGFENGQRADIRVPMAHIMGDQSLIIQRHAEHAGVFPEDMVTITIPDSHHHIMVDQPLALVSALRALLAVWPA